VIERDDQEGRLDAFKRVYELELGRPGELVTKRLVVDLMQLHDPDGISLPAAPGDVGLGERFALPFFTIECLALVDARHLLVGVDNNYPFSVGRHRGTSAPDDTELVLIELPAPLY
jgi:glycerophosphoryl diester phosphodiesterase